MTAAELAARVGAKRAGRAEWAVRCPAHDDTHPSLNFRDGRDGGIVFTCRSAGCATAAIIAAFGLTWADVCPTRHATLGEPLATYDYVDETGQLLFQVVRFPSKEFRQRRPDGFGNWIWKLDDTRRVLYRLPQLRAAVAAGQRVYVVEGEKDVLAVERAGAVATCNPMGAGKWRDEYGGVLQGADVVIVADQDEAGRAHARHVAVSLSGVARQVQLVTAAIGKDVSDHLAAGRELAALVALPVSGNGAGPTSPGVAEAPRFRLIPHDEWAAMPPPPWLVRGWLPLGSVAVLFGASSVGKSFVALELAYAVARGVPWLGQPVEQPGPVVYLAGEAGTSLRARCAAYLQYHGVARPAEVPLVIVPDLLRLAEWEDVNALTSALTARWPEGIRLIVLDTLAAACAGLLDENSSQEMTLALMALDALQQRTGATVQVVHHTGWATQDRERGSSALRGRWDVAMSLALGGDGAVTLTVPKARDFEQPQAIPIRLVSAHGSAVVQCEDRAPAARPLTALERTALRVLQQVGGMDGLGANDWWQATDAPRASFFRARKRLEQLDAVVCEHRRYRVTPLGESVL